LWAALAKQISKLTEAVWAFLELDLRRSAGSST